MINKISEHISYKEATRSATALRKGISNVPNPSEKENMRTVAEKVFEPLREWVGGPIRINSFFRSVKLNKAIGGSKRSQHCKGQAIDLDDSYGFKTNAEMFHYIKDNLDYDKLIWEFGDDENPDWVHVSYVSENNNRKMTMKAERKDGQTFYIYI